MPAGELIRITVWGFGSVFLVLFLLYLLTSLMGKIVQKYQKKQPQEQKTEDLKAKEPVRQISVGKLSLYGVDEKTAACIMAIVADSSGIPLDQLVFRSIRALD